MECPDSKKSQAIMEDELKDIGQFEYITDWNDRNNKKENEGKTFSRDEK